MWVLVVQNDGLTVTRVIGPFTYESECREFAVLLSDLGVRNMSVHVMNEPPKTER